MVIRERISRDAITEDPANDWHKQGSNELLDDINIALKKADLRPGEVLKYQIPRHDLYYLEGQYPLAVSDPRLTGSVQIHDVFHVPSEEAFSENRIWMKAEAKMPHMTVPFHLEAATRSVPGRKSELVVARHSLHVPPSATGGIRDLAEGFIENIDTFAKSAFNRGLSDARVTAFDVVPGGVIVNLRKNRDSTYPR